MTTRRPRTVVAVSLAVLAAVLALFAAALENANRDDRRDAEERFQDRARVTAALTESVFAASAATSELEVAKDLGSPEVDARRLQRRVRQADAEFAVVIGKDGRVVAASRGADSEVLELVRRDPAVARTLSGAAYALSDFLPSGPASNTLLNSLAFKGETGDRAYVTGFSVRVLSDFLSAYLARIPGVEGGSSYILDASGRVIATPVRDQRSGGPVQEPGLLGALRSGTEFGTFDAGGTERVFAGSGVPSSSWRVVLTRPTADLYAGISKTVEWLILLALAFAGLAAVSMLARAARAAAEAQAASARLEVANADLAQSNLELERSNGELEQFASVASHDLQEPLRKVQTFGDQLERRFGDSIPEEGLDYLQRMRSAAGRMSVLIDDLLRFSRVTTRALPPEPVDLARIAHEVASDLETVLEEAGGALEIGPLPVVEADPLQMRQLMQNLIGNAIKFHRPGEPPRVRVEAAQTGEPEPCVAFAVTDNGIGIEPEYRERIFRVFERLHSRDVYAGTGIGLALCRKIVERHGGSISVGEAPGGGSRFLVMLPQAADPAVPPMTDKERVPAHV